MLRRRGTHKQVGIGILFLPTAAVCMVLICACGADSAEPVTKRQATAFGRMVNIQRSDVPGMAVYVAAFETWNGPPFGRCTTNVSEQDRVAAIESPWLLRSKRRLPSPVRFAMPVPPVEGAHSVVYVMRESSIASRNVAAGRRITTPGCLTKLKAKEAARRFVGREPYKLGITASAIPFPLARVGGYGVRVQGTLARSVYNLKVRPTYYEDTFGFAVGSAEIVLVVTGVERPFPFGEERRLLSLLYSRAKTHEIS